MMKLKAAGAAGQLLLCSALVVVAADIQSQLTSQPDIEPVLKEMKKMRNLVAKQGKALDAMQTRLRASEETMQKLQSERGVQAASLIQALSQVEELKKNGAGLKVAFSAALKSHRIVGPYEPPDIPPLTFNLVFTNVGNAFSAGTGTFTAPVRGLYHFTLFVYGSGGAHTTGIDLNKNGQFVLCAFGEQPAGAVSSGNAASLPLEAGDKISVRLHARSIAYDSWACVTTFSGHLLFPM